MSPKIKWLAWGGVIILLVYTRFINLSWGLPFPFHPDERNIANAVQGLNCDMSNCFNPHFFAYGQLPIYLSYVLVFIGRLLTKISGAVQFDEAVMALRFLSATASLATVFICFKILKVFIRDTSYDIRYALPLILSPALIQFAHFGTTESLLALFFTWLIYLCLKLDEKNASKYIDSTYVWVGVVTGLAIATKISSLLFAVIPLLTIIFSPRNEKNEPRYQVFWKRFNELAFVGFVTGATAIIFSPFNLISWKDFTSSIEYESMVATGQALVFYTRTFSESVPVMFQFEKIFPYALGWPVLISFLVGFVFLPWKKNYNILRVAFLVYFLPTAFLFTKWTRFMAPIFPLIIVMAILLMARLPKKLSYVVCMMLIIPGIIFMNIYMTQDTRLQASHWMVKNIPANSVILQETANVVDLPLLPSSLKNISFNFYELDADNKLQEELLTHLKKTDYIIIPSRRIFKNHKADKYPILNKYYQDLFSGKLGFKQVAEFKVLDDEDAEETWTVFDHPVVRIYKRM